MADSAHLSTSSPLPPYPPTSPQPTGSTTPLDTSHLPSSSTSTTNTTTDPNHQHNTWPRGYRPYATLAGCFLLMFNSWGLVNAYGTFASFYSQTLLSTHDELLINLIGSTQSCVVLACSFAVGRALDAGYARVLVGVGAGLVTLGMFLLSVVNGGGGQDEGRYGAIWATQGLLVGMGMACFFVSSSQVAATWFVKQKAIAIGIVASGASIAGLVYPLMLRFLIQSQGFNNAVRWVATLVGVTSLISFFAANPNPAHLIRKPDRWSDPKVWFDSKAFRNAPFMWFSAGICFMFLGFYAVFFNLEEWAAVSGIATKNGLSQATSLQSESRPNLLYTFWLLCIMNGCSTFGRIGAALCSEKFGAVNIHVISTGTASLLILILWTEATSLAPTLAFVIIYGAVSGAVIGLPPASIAHILGRNNASQQAKLGQWTGMMYTAAAPFALVGPVIAGHMVTQFKTYLTIQGWCGGCMFVSTVCMAMARFYSGGDDGGRSLRESLEKLNLPSVGRAKSVRTMGGGETSTEGEQTPSSLQEKPAEVV